MSRNYEKKGYLLEDFRLFHLKDVQKTKIEYHYHEFYKLLFLISGKGSYSIEGKRYMLHAGDIVLLDKQLVHRPEFEEENTYERVILYISPEFLEIQSASDGNLAECFSENCGHILRPDDNIGKYLFKQLYALENTLNDTGFGRTVLCNSILLKLLVLLNRAMLEKESLHPDPIFPKSKRMQEMIQYLNDHLTEEISIDHLAEKFYLSRYHMMRRFKEETGTTIHTYLSDQRLLMARDLIRQGHPATEACFLSGFQNYASFSRAYGKLFGTTPTGRKMEASSIDASYE